MDVRIVDFELDPLALVSAYQQSRGSIHGRFGATSIFIGTMRDMNQGEAVEAMTLDHYPGMTEKHLARVGEEAAQKWDLMDSLVVHRVGQMQPGDPIVLVAVWSAHRDAAINACHYIIDELKTRAPFWKKELSGVSERWVKPGS